MLDILIRGGQILDGTGLPPFYADIAVQGNRICAIGRLPDATAHRVIDASGQYVAPGFIDAHVHGDLCLLDDPLHEPAIRQGVTTYILGQDGVAPAPASRSTLSYMCQYTAGFAGPRTIPERDLSIADFLDLFHRKCAVNIACLIPNGNVRMDVMGLDRRAPDGKELQAMRRLVRQAMEEGAVGLSSGLDYIPSRYADTAELAELCKEIAPFGGVYVTHMRRYDPDGVIGSMDEVFEIGRRSGAAVHISHFNSQAARVLPHLDQAAREGMDATYDLYCYLAGSTILGMIALPPEIQEGGVEATVARLRDPSIRSKLSEAGTGKGPIDAVKLSYSRAEPFRKYEGMALGDAAAKAGMPLMDFVCEILIAGEMAVGCISPHRMREEADIVGLLQHPAMMAGSDGIYNGGFPHPRGTGCFARYLGHYVREEKAWSWQQAVQHLSAHAARRFGLKDRGMLLPGLAADIIVFHPDKVQDRSTYEAGRETAAGMSNVLVNGVEVLQDSLRTAHLPGEALRRG